MRLNTKQSLTLVTIALSVVMLSSCSQKLQSNMANISEKPVPIGPMVQENTCLLSGPSKIAAGTLTALTLNYNFVVPDSAKLYWNGSNNGVDIAREAYGQSNIYSWSFEYLNTSLAGNYTRYITVVDAAGKTLCTSNVIQVELLPATADNVIDDGLGLKADSNCTQLGGSLGTSEDSLDLCTAPSWTLYNKMNSLNLLKPHTYGPNIGLPNPASVNCNDVGGIELNTATTTVCSVNKFTLLNNANAVIDLK